MAYAIKVNGPKRTQGYPPPPMSQTAAFRAALVCFTLFLIAAAIANAYLTTKAEWPAYTLLLLSFATWILVSTKVYGSEATGSPWWKPSVLISLWVLLACGVPGLLPYFDTTPLISLVERGVGFDLGYSAKALALFVVGVVLLELGYTWSRRVSSKRLAAAFQQRAPLLQRVISLYTATVAVRLLRIIVTGVAYGGDTTKWGAYQIFDRWLAYVEDLRFLCLALFIAYSVNRRWPKWPVFAGLAFEIFYAFTSGMMKPLLWVGLVAIGASTAASKSWLSKRKGLFAATAIIFCITGIIIVPVAETLRVEILTGMDTRSVTQITSGTVTAFDKSWGRGIDVGFKIFSDKMSNRQGALVHSVGLIMRDTPSVYPYEGVHQLLTTPLFILPRALWPDKPVISKGTWFSVKYLGYAEGTPTSSALTIFGEPYVDAGWFGLVISMPMLGFLLGCFYRTTFAGGLKHSNHLLLCMYLASLPRILGIESDMTSYFVEFAQGWVVLLVVTWLISWKLSPQPTVARIPVDASQQ